MKKREGKAYFKALREVVSEAVRQADQWDLLKGGAPLDEYDSEVGTILPRLGGATSAADVRAILEAKFIASLEENVAGARERYDRAVEKIWEFLSGTLNGLPWPLS